MFIWRRPAAASLAGLLTSAMLVMFSFAFNSDYLGYVGRAPAAQVK